MNIQKCDICKKELQDEVVTARAGFSRSKDFCLKCGKPILDFLKKHKFINEEKSK